jgi:deoxyribonuclease-1
MMQTKMFIFLILFSYQSLASQGDYYQNCDEVCLANATKPKQAIHSLIQRNHHSVGYDRAKELVFTQVDTMRDQQGLYFVDVYCDYQYYVSKGNAQPKPPKNNYINIEHTWPQSRFNSRQSKNLQKADMHHLYASYSRANSMRGNFPFGEVVNSGGHYRSVSNCRDSYLGEINHQKYFEPPFEHRGNVARALFYFSVRYQLPISATEELFLRKWHLEDPVDERERLRNDKIYQQQRNRNPFIDFPELVHAIHDF